MAQHIERPAVGRQSAPGRTPGQVLRRALGPDWQVALPFVLPMVILLGGLIAYPFFEAVRLSFTTRQLANATTFVGLRNYTDLWRDRFFVDAVRNTIVFTAYSVFFKIAVGMIAALLLHNIRRGRSILTGLVLLPWIVPTVVTALAWRSIFDPLYGGLNIALRALNLGGPLQALGLIDRLPVAWLGEPALAMPAIILVNVWKGIPFFTLNLLAGLKAIDNDLYEAAAVDGANSWQRFVNVTLPGLRYVLLVTALLSGIWTFNSFDVIYLLTGGGPGGSTRTYIIFAYEKAIEGLQFGPGAAVALTMLPLLSVGIFFLARHMRRGGGEGRETALDRFLATYGGWLTRVGLAVVLAILFLLDRLLFTRAAILLGLIAVVGLGCGRLGAALADRASARRALGGGKPSRLGRLPIWLAMAALLFFVLAPFYWILITAFKSNVQVTTQQSVLWPSPWTTAQFRGLVDENPFWTWFRNTILVAGFTTIFAVTFAALAGYALARLRFRGAQFLTGAVLLTYLVPGALLFIPLYQILSKLNLINTLGALMATYPTGALPFASWLLLGYFRGIPEELEQAAMIDGATRFQAFRKITLPLAKPALLAVALFTFTNAWNEFLFAFVFISKEALRTLPVGLQSMIFGDIYPWGQLMAASILMAVPVVILYGYAQKFLVEGLTAGSVKG